MTNMFLVLLIGAIFAQIFEKSGAALSIANTILKVFVKGEIRSSRGILTVVISQVAIAAIFMFGGIDGMTELDYGISDLSGYVQADEYYQKSGSGAGIYHRRLGDVLTGCTPGGKLSGSAVMRDFFYSRPDSRSYRSGSDGGIYDLVSVF